MNYYLLVAVAVRGPVVLRDSGGSAVMHERHVGLGCVRFRGVSAALGAGAVLVLWAALALWGLAFAQPGGFADVPEDAYYSLPVASLAEQGVFVGTECEEGFCPGVAIERKTVAVWVVRVLDGEDPEAVTQSRFDDVDAGGFHGAFIERMAAL